MSTRFLLAAAAASALALVPAAAAKDFGPGDLRVCSAQQCVAVTDSEVLPLLGSFYYGGPRPKAVAKARLRSPYFELRFRNNYVTGIVATAKLDRFLSYGVYLERFHRGTWYSLPARLSQEFRKLTGPLTPLRLTRAAIAKTR